jgi:phosphoribosylanthranilate isomerase
VEKVGVFDDADCDQIREVVLSAGLTAVQLHGKRSMDNVIGDSRTPEDCVAVSKVIAMIHGDALKNGGIFMSDETRAKTFAVLLDSRSNEVNGGTGTTFDWGGTRGMAQAMNSRVPVIVAGGLTPKNVSEAINIFQPFGVDVASGVEARPGKKDPEKVQAFVQAVREIDRKTS